MLSRFDLIFVLLDRPDEHMDQMLSRHVMSLHAGPRGPAARERGRAGEPAAAAWEQEAGYAEWQQKQPLSLRLRQDAEQTEPVPGPLLRKYIAYARTYCHPVLGERARAVLSAFYLQLRKTQRGGDSVPPATPHTPRAHRARRHMHMHVACTLPTRGTPHAAHRTPHTAHRTAARRTPHTARCTLHTAHCTQHAMYPHAAYAPQVPITTRQLESLVRLAEVRHVPAAPPHHCTPRHCTPRHCTPRHCTPHLATARLGRRAPRRSCARR